MNYREVMQQALEALERGETQLRYEAIAALTAALAEPEQEPVAWMFQHEETGRIMCVDAQQVEWGFEKGNPRLKKIAPLYTTPPARQWQGLTDEQLLEILQDIDADTKRLPPGFKAFARAIEAAHGIIGETK